MGYKSGEGSVGGLREGVPCPRWADPQPAGLSTWTAATFLRSMVSMSSENFLTSSKPSTSLIFRLGSTSLYFCSGDVERHTPVVLYLDIYPRLPAASAPLRLVHSHWGQDGPRPRKTSPNNRQETPLIRCPLIHILQRESEAQRGRELDRGHTDSAGAALRGCEARGVCAPRALQGWVLPDSRPVGLGALRGPLSRHLGPREALPHRVSWVPPGHELLSSPNCKMCHVQGFYPERPQGGGSMCGVARGAGIAAAALRSGQRAPSLGEGTSTAIRAGGSPFRST